MRAFEQDWPAENPSTARCVAEHPERFFWYSVGFYLLLLAIIWAYIAALRVMLAKA